MATLAEDRRVGLVLSKEDCDSFLVLLVFGLAVVSAFGVDICVREVLSAKGTHHLVFLQFPGVSVDQLGPFVHLMSSLLVKLFLVEVVLFL